MPAGYTLMLFLHWTGAEPFLGFIRLVFWVFLPIKLFQKIYRSYFDGVFQTEMLLHGVSSGCIIYVLDCVVDKTGLCRGQTLYPADHESQIFRTSLTLADF